MYCRAQQLSKDKKKPWLMEEDTRAHFAVACICKLGGERSNVCLRDISLPVERKVHYAPTIFAKNTAVDEGRIIEK